MGEAGSSIDLGTATFHPHDCSDLGSMSVGFHYFS